MKEVMIRSKVLNYEKYVNLSDIIQLLKQSMFGAGSLNAKFSIGEIIRSLEEGEDEIQ